MFCGTVTFQIDNFAIIQINTLLTPEHLRQTQFIPATTLITPLSLCIQLCAADNCLTNKLRVLTRIQK